MNLSETAGLRWSMHRLSCPLTSVMIGLYLQNLRAEAPVLPPGNAVILNCEVREIGMRRGTGIDLFIHHVGAVSPGAFRYRTSILPIWCTKGKRASKSSCAQWAISLPMAARGTMARIGINLAGRRVRLAAHITPIKSQRARTGEEALGRRAMSLAVITQKEIDGS